MVGSAVFADMQPASSTMHVSAPTPSQTHGLGASPEPTRGRDRTIMRRIGAVMAIEAVTLAVASALHLSSDAMHAGFAEAIIGAVLAGGSIAVFRARGRARTVGLAVNVFAIVGFIVGLAETTKGGDVPGIAYHLTVLPVLIGSVIVLLRLGRSASGQVRG